MEKEKITKQIIILLMDRNNPMSMGKAAAQASHASMAILLNIIREQSPNKIIGEFSDYEYNVNFSYKNEALHDWLNGRFRKIVCYVHTEEEELLEVYNKAKSNNLLCCLIQDAGFTHFDKPTYTSVGIGPAYAEDVDPITRKLRLLNTPVEDEIIK